MKKPSLFILNERTKYRTMVRALTALHRARPSPEYVAIACLIACYIDAIAANGGAASSKKFEAFLRKNFARLCTDLGKEVGEDGAHTFYAYYRSGLAHTFFTPSPRFALAEDHELHGKYAGPLETDGRTLAAINIDRLYRDFLALARRRAREGAGVNRRERLTS